MDQKSLDTGNECYWAALKSRASAHFHLYLISFASIYPDPELSSKDSASVVFLLQHGCPFCL